ncbi:MAG: hypothetical protein NVSMB51_01660 [Solirubrobacteraceae bacterium]
MPRRPSLPRRLGTATRWPVGIVLTSWSYLWRTTPMHRTLEEGGDADVRELPVNSNTQELQPLDAGVGPVFHRRYRTRIRDSKLGASELMAGLAPDLDQVAPNAFASFQKVRGREGEIAVDDEYVVRMPGPWDGPVRVVASTPTTLRLATLAGHLEAGQIEFRAALDEAGMLVFEIESWARSGDRLSDLLYDRLRFSREIQLHMWVSLIERVVRFAGGRMTGGVEILTRRVAS